ncbi:hypothetical protein [Methanococcoides seepicolus]|uniref:PIN domain-containing protein n=1 Tax=Methanococcoides seepicolus TaxID=2828780 RepID=A0A9E5DC36_9EURY|nr:hypothetical protein [Methanococcoides seepicolus]MCM1987013.1 hypothetical protein [Methanococcoides seepicolus]
MSIIYLDQWVYVRLLRSYKGLSPEYPKYANTCKGLIESAQNGVNIFPFSIAHIVETSKRAKLSSRKDVFKFIFDLSKFNTIRPWSQVIDLEIRNAILKSLNCDPCNLSNYVFGKEIGHCVGGKAKIVSKTSGEAITEIPSEIKDVLSSALTDSDMMANALCQDYMMEQIKQGIQEEKDLAKELEELRLEKYNHPDKKMRYKISTARFFITFIKDKFIKAVLEFEELDLKEYFQDLFSSEESRYKFLKSIPTAYVFHTLSQNNGCAIEPNDFWDIAALAIAIPYCDVVVTERKWSNILNQKKIGEMYNTKIIHNIEDLSTYI